MKSFSDFIAPARLPLACELPEPFWLLVCQISQCDGDSIVKYSLRTSSSGTNPVALRQIACSFGMNTAKYCEAKNKVSKES